MHQQLETYLEQVKAQLKSLPLEKQDEEVRELRQHLLALVEVGMEIGDSEDEAVAAAIRQFGKAKRVGRALSGSWRGTEKPLRVALAAVCVPVCNALFFYLGVMAWVFSDVYILKNNIWGNHNSLHPLAQGALTGCVFFAAPFLAGWIGGALARRKLPGVLVVVYSILALAFWLRLPQAEFHKVLIFFWMPFASVGAWSRAWLVRRRLARQA